jgi:hypothetical protein
MLRSTWIIKAEEDTPRLTSYFVLCGFHEMSNRINALDVVALLRDIPEAKLVQGQVGTVVETLGQSAYEVEFSGDDGRAYAMIGI